MNKVSIKSEDIVNNSYASLDSDNSFIALKSVNNIIILIYANKKKSILSFNLIDNKKINEIKNAHENYITNFRHYSDIINKRDLIISTSFLDNNIKLWDINNIECLLNIDKANDNGFIYSSCFLNNNNQLYILSSGCNDDYEYEDDFEPIKVYDFNGINIKEINDSNQLTFFIDTYFHNKLNKIFILTGNHGYAKSYDYNNNKLYHQYGKYDGNSFMSLVINHNDKDIQLVYSGKDGLIKIWNFDSGKPLKIIDINTGLYGICLWNNDYLFVGCIDNTIELINIKKGLQIKSLRGHYREVITVKKINHPQYGECLISQNFENSRIKLWTNLSNLFQS